ncbi:MAG: hypothetical protein J7M21_06180, partial [Planctomycetes bacterium]|nr:hypothetical protein [Planctomycetota bacterium]
FAVVLLGMVLFGAALVFRSAGGGDTSGGSGLRRLTDAEISEALSAPIEREPSPIKAAEALKQAVQSFENRKLWEEGDLYRCVKNFKLYRAYKHSQIFEKIEHERMAEQAERMLDELVRRKYDAAWKFEMAHRWRDAKTTFEDLMAILPIAELDKNGEIYRVIIKGNVIQHLNYIKKHIGRVREY